MSAGVPAIPAAGPFPGSHAPPIGQLRVARHPNRPHSGPLRAFQPQGHTSGYPPETSETPVNAVSKRRWLARSTAPPRTSIQGGRSVDDMADGFVVLSFCWVHVRRDFITIANERDDQEEWAEQWLADIAALYHLNDERLQVRAEPTQYAAADAALRAGVQAMQERRERELAQQPKLPAACAKVLRSLRNHWQGLTLFVENPDLPMDNNQAERALRGPVVGRKNYYGSGAQWSGELSAALFSLFHTLERWRINPRTWLTEYLNACAVAGGRVPADFERFLPWNRRAARVPRAAPAQVVDSRAA